DHPYAIIFEYKWPYISEPGATEIRLHFSDLDIGNYDKLIILDKYGNDLVTYSYITKADFWTEWYAGDTLAVRLITSDQGTGYGFKIDKLDSRLDMCISNNSLAESYHPYANSFEYKWPDISEPGATEIRLHFESLSLANSDILVFYDKYDNKLVTYEYGQSSKDFWTEWYTGDTLKVKLVTDNSGTAYGFKIDEVEGRSDMCISNNSLAESYHPYANNFYYKWPDISKPGATQIRIHFESLNLADTSDKVVLYDKYDNKLVTYSLWDSSKDFWTEWYTGDTLKVKLITGNSGTAYGFKIDKGEIKNDRNVTTMFSESSEVSNPNSKRIGNKVGDEKSSRPSDGISNDFQNPTTNSDSIHNLFVKIAVTLNILEEDDDQSWMYRNIELVFGGLSLLLAIVGFLKGLNGKRSEDKKSEDEKSEDRKPEDEKS
ncbi:MAG: hypothetical protein GX152_08480, partial [Methanosarcina sp.]|nr:hypothetical protein [Methanosarcina sp.]